MVAVATQTQGVDLSIHSCNICVNKVEVDADSCNTETVGRSRC